MWVSPKHISMPNKCMKYICKMEKKYNKSKIKWMNEQFRRKLFWKHSSELFVQRELQHKSTEKHYLCRVFRCNSVNNSSSPFNFSSLIGIGDSSNVLHYVLAGFCLSCSTFPCEKKQQQQQQHRKTNETNKPQMIYITKTLKWSKLETLKK